MDIGKVLVELRQELDTLNAAILSLERLQNVPPRRGRPRASVRRIAESGPMARTKAAGLAEARRDLS